MTNSNFLEFFEVFGILRVNQEFLGYQNLGGIRAWKGKYKVNSFLILLFELLSYLGGADKFWQILEKSRKTVTHQSFWGRLK